MARVCFEKRGQQLLAKMTVEKCLEQWLLLVLLWVKLIKITDIQSIFLVADVEIKSCLFTTVAVSNNLQKPQHNRNIVTKEV